MVQSLTKRCTICDCEKNLIRFDKNRNQCKTCRNEYKKTLHTRRGEGLYVYNLYKKYKLTKEMYFKISLKQNNVCAICKQLNTSGPHVGKLVVDHCHKTGQVRGLLCDSCNRGISQLKDDILLLENAIQYLKEPPFKKLSEAI